MMHSFLHDPERLRAYQLLCDRPSGSTRSWAAQLGWKHSKLDRFLSQLKKLGIAQVDRLGNYGSVFRPVSPRLAASRGVSGPDVVLDVKLDKLPRYGEAPAKTATATAARVAVVSESDETRLIDALNSSLASKFEQHYTPIAADNIGSLRAAKKILAQVPIDRAVTLVNEAGWAFTPDKTGGDLPRSLGHPFLFKYVTNEWRRIKRELERGQLSLLFVERVAPPLPVYGARKNDPEPGTPPATPEAITAGHEEFARIAGNPIEKRPRRM